MSTFKIFVTTVAAIVLSTTLVASPASAASPTGHKQISASVTADNQILVKWKATSGIKFYNVKTSSTPDMTQNVKTYKTTDTSLTVKATKYGSVNSGNYTFVRVYAVKKNGKVGESPYREIRLDPITPDAAASRISVATFNVRTAEATAEAKTPGHKWSSRISAVAGSIRASGASVIGLQEAGAPSKDFEVIVRESSSGKSKIKDFNWQFEQLRDAVGGSYALANSDEYRRGANGGKEGTRILYDASKVKMLEQGNFAPSAVNDKLRWVPWAKFQDLASQKSFYFISAHLAADQDDRSRSESATSKLRASQIGKIIKVARGFAAGGTQVILTGDLNSNMYTLPKNVVGQKLTDAGFYDAYATANNDNEFFVTYNNFGKSKKSASRTDYIMTFGGPKGSYSYKNWITRSGTIPSDHNMQSATLPI